MEQNPIGKSALSPHGGGSWGPGISKGGPSPWLLFLRSIREGVNPWREAGASGEKPRLHWHRAQCSPTPAAAHTATSRRCLGLLIRGEGAVWPTPCWAWPRCPPRMVLTLGLPGLSPGWGLPQTYP